MSKRAIGTLFFCAQYSFAFTYLRGENESFFHEKWKKVKKVAEKEKIRKKKWPEKAEEKIRKKYKIRGKTGEKTRVDI